MKLKSQFLLNTIVAASFLLGVATQAEDKKTDATGTWSWTVTGRNGGPERVSKLTLKAEGDKLTGKLSAPGREGQNTDTAIADGKVEGDAISFSIVREFNGNSSTIKYTGKVSADKITGKTEFQRNGEKQSRDWEAKREGSTTAPGKASASSSGLAPEAAAKFIAGHEGAVLLDVRSATDHAAGHLPHAKNIDFQASDFKEQVAQLDKDKDYVVYCTRGLNKTAKTVELLNSLGATNVFFVAGGYNAWTGAGQPIEK